MKNKKYRVYLSKEQRKELENITKRGKQSATIIKRANILLNLDENNGRVQSQEEIAKQLCTTAAVLAAPLCFTRLVILATPLQRYTSKIILL